MHDQFDSRIWLETHSQFSADVARLLQSVKIIFCKMADINFRAPWRKTASRC